ncbi:MAG TPA: LuxR C-terminal-related transcriptional regulator [Tepidisphaeraceae bacterium]|nr:LuxR C-terminal-related transcriptional regulator [Tepidisphaeraceae bacterium]
MAEQRLKLRAVRDIFRLIGEVRELGSDPQKWRPHMVARLRKLLGAQIVISSEIHFRRISSSGQLRVIDIGWGCDPDGQCWQIHTEREDEKPDAYWVMPGQAAPGEKSGEEMIPVTPVKPLYGGSCFVLSQLALPHAGTVDQLGLHRASGDQPFTWAEHRLVRLFHVELGRIWRRDILQRVKDPTADLAPRLAQTLAALLEGDSEKQIAQKLGLSHHTIHNYVKALHQRFEVSSRGELLAKAGKIRASFLPQFSIQPSVDETGKP